MYIEQYVLKKSVVHLLLCSASHSTSVRWACCWILGPPWSLWNG